MISNAGEVLITLGAILLLYCVYQLFWTNIESRFAQDSLRHDLTKAWQDPARQPGLQATEALTAPPPGKPLAIIHIPRLGADFSRVVVEGVRLADLARGPGHYPGTALPGQVGNLAIAGHRATNGEPFRRLNVLGKGDVVVLETRDTYYTYVVDSSEIVEPTTVNVILPVPNAPGVRPVRPLLTLTTCHPRWASTHRLIVYAHLQVQQPKSAGLPPALTEAASGGMTADVRLDLAAPPR
jgi:sortase A